MPLRPPDSEASLALLDRVAARLPAAPATLLVVGDPQGEVALALAGAGFRTTWLSPPAEPGDRARAGLPPGLVAVADVDLFAPAER